MFKAYEGVEKSKVWKKRMQKFTVFAFCNSSFIKKPETEWSSHEQAETFVNSEVKGRTHT